MGFEVPRRTARIQFEEHPGMEIECALDISLGAFFEFQRLTASKDQKDVEKAMQQFGEEIVISWNLEIDGIKLPATGEGMLRLPPAFALVILNAWVGAVQELPLEGSEMPRDGRRPRSSTPSARGGAARRRSS